jgi:glutamate racemase
MDGFDDRPVGVFDSGVGGLTVLRALRARLPGEHTVYLGDTARVPYGTKSAEVVIRYALKNARFLLRRNIKLLVVACNTASSVALPALTEALPVPVVGVIEPGAVAALAATRSRRVGVLGTPATVRSGAYLRVLERLSPGIFVWSQACPLFVPLAEEGWVEGEVPSLAARRYLAGLREAKVDTLVLGCTHYPLLRDIIAAAAGSDVSLVDSGEAAAAQVASMIDRKTVSPAHGHEVSTAYFVTDLPQDFGKLAARFLGSRVDQVEQVDL